VTVAYKTLQNKERPVIEEEKEEEENL